MDEFVSEKIEVSQAQDSPRPVAFKWRGRVHEVAEVLRQRVDAGFGDLPPRSRRWYTRHHRRYYVVRDSDGEMFEIYLDYSNRQEKTWYLLRRITTAPSGTAGTP